MSENPFRPVAELRALCGRIQSGSQAILIKDSAQREYDAELRAYEALVARGNAVLASAGVAISLLMGLVARSDVIRGLPAKVLLASGLALALLSCVCSVVGVKFRRDVKVMNDETVFAGPVEASAVDENDDAAAAAADDDWRRRYLLMLALGYSELRERLFLIRQRRGSWLIAAQITFLLFLFNVASLALTLVL